MALMWCYPLYNALYYQNSYSHWSVLYWIHIYLFFLSKSLNLILNIFNSVYWLEYMSWWWACFCCCCCLFLISEFLVLIYRHKSNQSVTNVQKHAQKCKTGNNIIEKTSSDPCLYQCKISSGCENFMWCGSQQS